MLLNTNELAYQGRFALINDKTFNIETILEITNAMPSLHCKYSAKPKQSHLLQK